MWVDLTNQIGLYTAKIYFCLRQVHNLSWIQAPNIAADCVLEHERRTVKSLSIRHNERRVDRSGLKEIWVIANLAKLHKHIHYGEEICLNKCALCPVIIDVLIIQKTLSSGQIALHDVLNLFGKLFFHISFQSAEQEGSQNALQLLDHAQIQTLVLVYALTEWVAEPLLEVLLT